MWPLEETRVFDFQNNKRLGLEANVRIARCRIVTTLPQFRITLSGYRIFG